MCKEENKYFICINEDYQYALTEKVVAIMFKKYKEKIEKTGDESISIANKKCIIKKFENVMKCLRYERLGANKIYENNQDNLQALVELSEVISIEASIKELIEEYKNICKEKIEIIVSKESKSEDKIKKELEEHFKNNEGIKITIETV